MFYYDALDDKSLVLDADMDKIATAKQIRALEQDERLGLVQEYLERKLPKDWADKDLTDRRFWLDEGGEGSVQRTEVSIMEVWAECFRMSPAAKKRSDSDDIVRILTQLGWKRVGRSTKRLPIYGAQGYYKQPGQK
jgi:hypothetical protein